MANVTWTVAASARGIVAITKRADASRPGPRRPIPVKQQHAEKELQEYFSGRLRCFTSTADLRELSPFTQAVLRLTARIPYGEVRSYSWLARALGKPKAARAVGNALARNPVPILIPCHRVVRRDGVIGPFVLGSRWKKRLLALEKRHAKSVTSPPSTAFLSPSMRNGSSVNV